MKKKKLVFGLLLVPIAAGAVWWMAGRSGQATAVNESKIVMVDRGLVRSIVTASGASPQQ